MKKISVIVLSAMLCLTLISCSDSNDGDVVTTLPPVETVGVPEESVTDSQDIGTFKVNIYKTYAEIAQYTGKGQSELVIPDSFFGYPVKVIGEYAFFGNEELEKVTLPSGLIKLGRFAFEECSALKEVVANEGLEVIGQSAFRNSSLERISIPSTVVTIGKQCFYRTSITEVVIPDGVSIIASHAFYGCEKLISVSLGARVATIDEKAFYNCTALEKLIFPENVTKIGDYAFMSCTSLRTVFVPKHTTLGENVFHGCSELIISTPKGAKCIASAKIYGYEYVLCASAEELTTE